MFCKKFLPIAAVCLLITACQKPAEDGDSVSPPSGGGNVRTGEATTDCGVVTNGKVSNPVSLEDGKIVTVTQVISANLVSIQEEGGGAQLLKLQGVGSNRGVTSEGAKQMIKNLTASRPTFFKASNDCNVTLDGGGQGTIGQLITSDGKSVSESLVRSGLVEADTNDACGGNQIGACLSALNETNNEPLEEMQDFLWKPLSDTKGPIAVAMEKHCNTTIKVNGQAFSGAGAGNGRCNTSSGSKAGCSYGSNIRVEVIDNNTGRPYTYKGQPYVIVPNGCSRFEFK